MMYALIRDGIVGNTISLNPDNVGDFPDAVHPAELPVRIGDTYADGAFFRDGQRLLTPLEKAQATIAELDARVLELECANAMASLGL